MLANNSGRIIGTTNIAKKWGWFVALGIAMIVLGVIAWLDVVAVTIAGTIFVGVILFLGGAFQIIQAFMTKGWRGFTMSLFCGILYLAGGVLIMNEPEQGALLLTLLVVAALMVGGVVRIILALMHRNIAAWGLVLLSGIVSIVVGYLLYANLPWSGLWVVSRFTPADQASRPPTLPYLDKLTGRFVMLSERAVVLAQIKDA